MNYRFMIGKQKLIIKDAYDLTSNLKLLYDECQINNESCDYICNIMPMCGLGQYDSFLINNACKTRNKLFIGLNGDKYYTIATHKPIYIITDKKTNQIDVYTGKDVIDNMSIYLFHIMIKKHICRLVFESGCIPIHGALLHNNTKNKCFLVTGDSNTGKSSVAYHLMMLGFDCVSDDICVYDAQNGLLSGATNGVYVTEDFIKRYNIMSNTICISPGRKHRIKTHSKPNAFPIQSISLLFTLGFNGVYPHCKEELLNYMKYAHKNWFADNTEEQIFSKSITQLVECCDKYYAINFSQHFVEDIINIVNIT